MSPVRPEFVPDPEQSHDEMAALQREIADVAIFEDRLDVDPRSIRIESSVDPVGEASQRRLDGDGTDPVVAGVDQAFLDDRAISAVVAVRDGEVVERVHAVEPLTIPYIPGLLAFREGGPILAAFEALEIEPDVVLFDGSGRIHFREAGIATHVGVVLDVPSVGVAKSLLCGEPRRSVDGLDAGERVPVVADERVEADADTVLGHAVQTRQFPDSRRINPVYVSPGHRVGADTAAAITLGCCAGYKLPEPIRLADRYAGDVRDNRR